MRRSAKLMQLYAERERGRGRRQREKARGEGLRREGQEDRVQSYAHANARKKPLRGYATRDEDVCKRGLKWGTGEKRERLSGSSFYDRGIKARRKQGLKPKPGQMGSRTSTSLPMATFADLMRYFFKEKSAFAMRPWTPVIDPFLTNLVNCGFKRRKLASLIVTSFLAKVKK